MRKEQPLPAGKLVRIDTNATVVGLVDATNPYWYTIEHPDGTQEQVNVSRLRWFEDAPRATIDTDGCVQVFTPKLTARGAIALFHWLRTHLPELEALTTAQGSEEKAL